MEYYTYAYLREDGTPYYIGKGKGRRAYQKSHSVAVPPKDRILFLKTNLTEEEAFVHEIYMISILGRKDLGKGMLRNKTFGGEGTSGIVVSEESKRKMSEAQKKKPSYGMLGKNHTEQSIQKMREASTGKSMSIDTKRKLREATKRRWKDGDLSTEKNRKKLSQSLCKKQYIIISPEGKKFYTNNVMNFATTYELDFSSLYKVARGKLKHCKGWIVKTLEQ
jgi:hypothetical protein